ncbi:MAG: hypothetical protein V1798_06135 [Pseudomonadota bacterium]
MKTTKFFALILLMSAPLARAEGLRSAFDQIRLSETPFSINTGFDALRSRMKKEWQTYAMPAIANGADRKNLVSPTECAELVEVAHTYLCATYKQEHMNLAFSRIALFSEGFMKVPKGTLVRPRNGSLQANYEESSGHDIKSPEILGFYEGMRRKHWPLKAEEKAFETNVLNKLVAKNGDSLFVVITVSIQSPFDFRQAASHETLHAQYFFTPALQGVVKDYWTNHLTDADRNYVKTQFSGVYREEDAYVFMNEFFAYMLEFNAANDRLRDLARTQGEDFREFVVAKTGLSAIRIQGS